MNFALLLLSVLSFASCIHVTYGSGTRTKTVDELDAKIDAIEKQCIAQNLHRKDENRKLKDQLEDVRAVVVKQEARIAHLQDQIKDMQKHTIKDMKNVNKGLKRKTRFLVEESETVAFHATLAGGGAIRHLHINQTIIFDNVMLNLGGAYHSQHGLFVANTPGIYIFSVSIMALSGGSDSTMVFIMKNGQEVAAAIADGRGSPHDQGSTTVVLQLQVGDEVWVSVQRHDDTAIWTDSLDSFMGCLVAPA